ncbi:MBOAT family O-acyltransferase [Flavobacteriaceae bacterium S356]|uniref:MBOAT family O-acyltransferase n=1 Tax=Asprobacillus argus TaxID=3076534 RepID=A0ABU3LIB3_9FLAO|nr:MBOAT family O-acyltransferase [Flavobacteriaceae bacterium S356]
MLFNSIIFFIFLGVVVPLYYALPNKRIKHIFLVLASYFFYGYWDWRFCSLLLISTIIDFFVAKALATSNVEKKRRFFLGISLFANLGILFFFKYFNFFIDSFQSLSSDLGVELDFLHLNILLPVGISFYTFQTLSYTIDVYRRKLKPTDNFVDFALFVSFFPQLVAGPIERAASLLPQLSKNKGKINLLQMKEGVVLIVMGLFRKVMIGDTSGRYVDHIFGNIETYSSGEVLAALFLFSIQIYADFSGYSKIARGTAKLLGIELMKNFEQPYLSTSITEFWRRWHISLSSWLKDYLYFSLGGNRNGKTKMYRNLMLTMLLGGLWHGASWNFVIWGGLHGLYLIVHKLMLKGRKVQSVNLKKFSVKDVLNIFGTYLLVLLTWLFFRATDFATVKVFFRKMAFWESSDNSMLFLSIVLAYTLMTLFLDTVEYRTQKHTFILDIRSNGIKLGILFALFVVSVIYMVQVDPLPFIYFQF